MKIFIQVADQGGMKKVEVDGSVPFEMYGLPFAAHRRYSPGMPARLLQWRVSELSTGFGVSKFCDTRTEAIRDAYETLERVGGVRVQEEVKKQLRKQKRLAKKMKVTR